MDEILDRTAEFVISEKKRIDSYVAAGHTDAALIAAVRCISAYEMRELARGIQRRESADYIQLLESEQKSASKSDHDYARRFAAHGSASDQLDLIEEIIKRMISEQPYSTETARCLSDAARYFVEAAREGLNEIMGGEACSSPGDQNKGQARSDFFRLRRD